MARDDRLAQEIGLTIQPDRSLPDLILVDLGPAEPLRVFVEVVATAGPVNEDQVAFVTACADRDEAAFKSPVSELAWRSFVWFMSEPDHIDVPQRGFPAEKTGLSDLMRT